MVLEEKIGIDFVCFFFVFQTYYFINNIHAYFFSRLAELWAITGMTLES